MKLRNELLVFKMTLAGYHMKKLITFVCFCLFFPVATFGNSKFIEPTNDFVINFCNFPYAWTISKGKNINVGIICNDVGKGQDWISKISALASEAKVRRIKKENFILSKDETLSCQVLLLSTAFNENEYIKVLASIQKCTETGIVTILPAYFGPLSKDVDYKTWYKFVKKASKKGAIIVGAHGRAYEFGGLSFWKALPIDVHALNPRIDGGKYSKPDAAIDVNIEDSAYLAAGVAALLKSKMPQMLPSQIKKAFRKNGRQVYWMHVDIEYEIEGEKGNERINLSPKLHTESIANDSQYAMIKNQIEKNKKEHPDSYFKVEEVIDFECSCLDAALIMGLKPIGDGEWTRQVLNVTEAQKLATGKNVVVAIVDWLFDKDDESLQNRLVKPGSVVEGAGVFDMGKAGHGTWMAGELVKIAPDVKIMPIRIRPGNPDDYIKAIEYAIKNGADIISLSHQAVPKAKQQDLDKAIEKASQKGITFVYIHYEGKRGDVIIPCPIEFANKYNKNKRIFVVGTNFINEASFPYTWGFSQTAPIVSGVIAMLKELDANLTPVEIKKILLKSNNTIRSGYPMLDALKAVERVKKR